MSAGDECCTIDAPGARSDTASDAISGLLIPPGSPRECCSIGDQPQPGTISITGAHLWPVRRNVNGKSPIVGVAESDLMGNVPDKSSLQHHAEAAQTHWRMPRLQLSDVNGLMTAGSVRWPPPEYIGLQPSFPDNTSVGGSSFVIHVAHAAAAIRAGYCDTVLITHGQAGRSTRAPVPPARNLPVAQYEIPYGMIGSQSTTPWALPVICHEYGEGPHAAGIG